LFHGLFDCSSLHRTVISTKEKVHLFGRRVIWD
jgi:hypothetical protein